MPIYLTLYIWFLTGFTKTARFIMLCFLFIFSFIIVKTAYHFSQESNVRIASCLSFIVQSSQIWTIIQVAKTKNSIYIDILFIYAFTATNVFNTIYGLLKNNIDLWISMIWGFLWNVIQIVMYYMYDKDERNIDEIYENNETKDILVNNSPDNNNHIYIDDTTYKKESIGSEQIASDTTDAEDNESLLNRSTYSKTDFATSEDFKFIIFK